MIDKKQLLAIFLKNALVSLVFIFAAVFIVLQISKQMQRVGDSITKQRQATENMSRRSETYAEIKNTFASLGDIDTKIQQSLLSSEDVAQFTGDLEQLASQNGVNQGYHLNTPSLSAEQGDLIITSIDYSLEIQTNTKGLISYLKDFETMPYFSNITNIHIGSDAPEGINGISNISMNAKLFVKQYDY